MKTNSDFEENRNCPEVGPELVLDIAQIALRSQLTTRLEVST